ncbi:hypothetical protein DFH09DRAFT_1307264 [Mycena vulgaris]|nr:hypothetical protein DFH09DRAFT_1307264 [Mycena vulgaris]
MKKYGPSGFFHGSEPPWQQPCSTTNPACGSVSNADHPKSVYVRKLAVAMFWDPQVLAARNALLNSNPRVATQRRLRGLFPQYSDSDSDPLPTTHAAFLPLA